MEAFRARRLLISKWSVIQKYKIRSTVLTFTFLQMDLKKKSPSKYHLEIKFVTEVTLGAAGV